MFVLTLYDRSRIESLQGGKKGTNGKRQNKTIIFTDFLLCTMVGPFNYTLTPAGGYFYLYYTEKRGRN